MVEKDQLKDSVLDNSAEIYKPRKEQTEKQKLNEMTWKEKITYFNNYYRVATLVGIAVIAAVIYLIYNIVTPKPEPILYAAVIDSVIDNETAQTLQTDFGNKLGIDPKTEEIMIDTSFFIGSDSNMSEYSMSSQQKLSTYFFAGQIDVLIAPESFFANYARLGNLCKLSDEMPTDLCTKLAGSFYNSVTEESPALSPYGIYLDGAKIYDNKGQLMDRPILGIVVNSKYKENAVEFIRYLFNY